ncbi:MAG: hypothetical protein KIT84_14740 [Labilithrix sp.]|nr:hypothetical protein [Labilithrix sp.]MCW5812279.1 hypothetical protein [Labilithrix sp.]
MRRPLLALLFVSACEAGDAASPRGVVVADAAAAAPDAADAAAPRSFWHLERPPDSERAWMVSPRGERTFVLGVDGVLRADGCDGMSEHLRRSSPEREWASLTALGFNSAGAFSEIGDLDAPYSVVLSPVPRGDDRALKDASGAPLVTGRSGVKVGDPWSLGFRADLEAMLLADVRPLRDDPRLQVFYLGHETGMFEQARDLRPWLWSDCPATSTVPKPHCAPHALVKFLHLLYPSVAALNAAWGSSFASIEEVATAKPAPDEGARGRDLQRFVLERLLPEWVNLVLYFVRTASGRHVVAAPRLALGELDPERASLLARFDLVALNLYSAAPTFEEPWLGDALRLLAEKTQLPVIVSETGLRARIDGWTNTAPPLVETQAERGARYASQLAQLAAYPSVVGVHWSAWSDRRDATAQANTGLVQCADPARGFTAGTRWPGLDAPLARANVEVGAALGR